MYAAPIPFTQTPARQHNHPHLHSMLLIQPGGLHKLRHHCTQAQQLWLLLLWLLLLLLPLW
jgi:hypothetical protein